MTLNPKKDRPINYPDEDKLGYGDLYASELMNLIVNNNENSTIGLFGEFGSGKTSVINLLKNKLNNKIKLIHVKSVWDYSSNNIIKKILIEIDTDAHLKLNFAEKLSQEETKINPKMVKKSIRTISKLLVIYFLISIMIFIFIKKINIPEVTLPEGVIEIIGGLITVGIGIYFGNETLGKITITPPATIHDFERYWNEVINKLDKKSKIILVIDDLDRCNPKQVNEILGKLNYIVKSRKKNKFEPTVIQIIPFSLGDYLQLYDPKEVELLKQNYVKYFDYIVDMPKLGVLELEKLSEKWK